eukprot:648926-Pelagomonas_calceolata.AAC.1
MEKKKKKKKKKKEGQKSNACHKAVSIERRTEVPAVRAPVKIPKNERSHGEESLPTSIQEKETHWLKRAESPLHHKAGTEAASGELEGPHTAAVAQALFLGTCPASMALLQTMALEGRPSAAALERKRKEKEYLYRLRGGGDSRLF